MFKLNAAELFGLSSDLRKFVLRLVLPPRAVFLDIVKRVESRLPLLWTHGSNRFVKIIALQRREVLFTSPI